MPLHIALAEVVLCHGGTLELVRILNRLGATASVDTVNRLATHVVHTLLSEGIISELKPLKLSIVSVDNIDIMQSHGFVSKPRCHQKLACDISSMCTTPTSFWKPNP